MAEANENIIRYLQEEMDSSEKAAFEAALADSAELRESLAEMRRAVQASQLFGQLKLREQLGALEAELDEVQPAKVRSFRLYWVAAASVLVIALAGIWYFNRPLPAPQYFAQYFEPYRAPVNIRSSPGVSSIWEQGRKAYEAGDFPLAAERFGSITSTTGIPTYLRDFYWGVSLLSQDPPKAQRAVDLLKNIAALTTDYQQPATWYLALAYLQLDQKEEARYYLQQLRRYRSAEAKEILKGL
ncbi:MAG: hypothetical protein AAFN10_08065 [Bacteroidota bacterium]